jgi:hypothetical protein
VAHDAQHALARGGRRRFVIADGVQQLHHLVGGTHAHAPAVAQGFEFGVVGRVQREQFRVAQSQPLQVAVHLHRAQPTRQHNRRRVVADGNHQVQQHFDFDGLVLLVKLQQSRPVAQIIGGDGQLLGVVEASRVDLLHRLAHHSDLDGAGGRENLVAAIVNPMIMAGVIQAVAHHAAKALTDCIQLCFQWSWVARHASNCT